MTPERRLKLMAFADGELEGAEREEVLAWLAADAQAARFVNELATLGDLVKLGHEGSSRARAIASFDATDAIMAKVAAESAVVVPFDAARARRRRNVAVAATIGAAATVLAVAASVMLVVRPATQLAKTIAPPTAAPLVESGPGIEIDVDEARGSSVSVFFLPSESSLTTSVLLWVDETGEK